MDGMTRDSSKHRHLVGEGCCREKLNLPFASSGKFPISPCNIPSPPVAKFGASKNRWFEGKKTKNVTKKPIHQSQKRKA